MLLFILSFGYWFWGLVIAEFILLTWFVEKEWPGPSLLSLAAFMFLLWWLADVPIWAWIKENPGLLVKYFIFYIIAGLVWAIAKYYFVLKRIRKTLKKLKAVWIVSKDKLSPDVANFKDYVAKTQVYNEPVDFEGSTRHLVFWASFWPTSLFWTILNDPIRRLFKWLIHDVFIGIFRKMHEKMVGSLL